MMNLKVKLKDEEKSGSDMNTVNRIGESLQSVFDWSVNLLEV